MKDQLFILCALLFLVHWAGDYTHLSTDRMLAAKAKGKPLGPIAEHAGVHAALTGLVVLTFSGMAFAFVAFVFMFLTHFAIDVAKGTGARLSEPLRDHKRRPYWYAFGIDQYLHAIVLLLIAFACA